MQPENPDTPNNPDSDDDGSDNSSNPPVDDSLQENPPTDPTPDNNEPEIPVEPEPEPEPLVRFDFTIYNKKSNVVYDLENGKILVNLTENINDNIVHFNCLIYVDNNLSVNQTIIYTLTNEDKLANTKPQNLSNFLFKFSTAGTYVLTLSNSDESCVKTINIIVE